LGFSSTMIPVDDVRLATGEVSERARIMVNLSTMKVVAVGVNGGLVVGSSYHWAKLEGRVEVEGMLGEAELFEDGGEDRGYY
jgi:hypothetical protein